MSDSTHEFELSKGEVLFDPAALAELLADESHPAHAFSRFPRRLDQERKQGNALAYGSDVTVRLLSWEEEGLGEVRASARLHVPSGRLVTATAAHPAKRETDCPTRPVAEVEPGTYYVWTSEGDQDSVLLSRVDTEDTPRWDADWAGSMAKTLKRCPSCRAAVQPTLATCPKCRANARRDAWNRTVEESPVTPEEVNGERCRRCGQRVMIRYAKRRGAFNPIPYLYLVVVMVLSWAGLPQDDFSSQGMLFGIALAFSAPLFWAYHRNGGRRFFRSDIVVCDDCGLVAINGSRDDTLVKRFLSGRAVIERTHRSLRLALLALAGLSLGPVAMGDTPDQSLILCLGVVLLALCLIQALRPAFCPAAVPWWRRLTTG